MGKSDADLKELKAMIAVAKQKPVNIGICLGKKAENLEVKMDRNRSPSAMGREAKAAGETAKVAVGVLTVEAKKATITCEEAPPAGLGKQLKKFFKSIDMPMKFTIIDPDGKEVNEEDDDDGEEGGQDGAEKRASEGADEEEEEVEAEAEAKQPAAAEAAPDAKDGAEDKAKATWTVAWAIAEPKVGAAIAKGDASAAKITAVRDFVVGKATARQFEAAVKALPSLLGLLAATSAAAPEAPAAEKIDPKELVRRLGVIKPQLPGVPGALGQKLTEMFQAAVDVMKTGDLAKATSGIAQIEAALAKVAGAKPAETAPDPKFAKITEAEAVLRKQVTAQTAGDAQDGLTGVLDSVLAAIGKGEAEVALAGLKRVQDGLKLQAEIDRLAPLVAKAASSGMVADVNRLNNLFNSVAETVPATDHAKAMANLARVAEMITEGAAQGQSAQAKDVAPEVKPLATARINWISTRKSLHDELAKLEHAISTALKAAGMDGELEVAGALIQYIDKLDARLEAKLDAIVNADPDNRAALKADARNLISEYQGVLQSDFFKDVDNSNGFMSVAVTSTAQSMLQDIAGVLA